MRGIMRGMTLNPTTKDAATSVQTWEPQAKKLAWTKQGSCVCKQGLMGVHGPGIFLESQGRKLLNEIR